MICERCAFDTSCRQTDLTNLALLSAGDKKCTYCNVFESLQIKYGQVCLHWMDIRERSTFRSNLTSSQYLTWISQRLVFMKWVLINERFHTLFHTWVCLRSSLPPHIIQNLYLHKLLGATSAHKYCMCLATLKYMLDLFIKKQISV